MFILCGGSFPADADCIVVLYILIIALIMAPILFHGMPIVFVIMVFALATTLHRLK